MTFNQFKKLNPNDKDLIKNAIDMLRLENPDYKNLNDDQMRYIIWCFDKGIEITKF